MPVVPATILVPMERFTWPRMSKSMPMEITPPVRSITSAISVNVIIFARLATWVSLTDMFQTLRICMMNMLQDDWILNVPAINSWPSPFVYKLQSSSTFRSGDVMFNHRKIFCQFSMLCMLLLIVSSNAHAQHLTVFTTGPQIKVVDEDLKPILEVAPGMWGPGWKYQSFRGNYQDKGNRCVGSFGGKVRGTDVPFDFDVVLQNLFLRCNQQGRIKLCFPKTTPKSSTFNVET